MQKLILMLFIFSLVIPFVYSTQADTKAEEAAIKATQSWLDLVDNGKYEDSWQEAAPFFKSSLTKQQWVSAVNSARSPLGKLMERKLKAKQYTKMLPGAPAGEYYVIQYETSFEHKSAAIETVTPMLDKDGKWRVTGYYVK